jgi:D-serine deaminase-like pyridoxal phosphate-dependent protein
LPPAALAEQPATTPHGFVSDVLIKIPLAGGERLHRLAMLELGPGAATALHTLRSS